MVTKHIMSQLLSKYIIMTICTNYGNLLIGDKICMMLIDWLLLNLHSVQLFDQNADCCLVIDHMHINDVSSMGIRWKIVPTTQEWG